MRRATCLALVVALGSASSAQASEGLSLPRPPESLTRPPPGFILSGNSATALARRQPKVQAEASKSGQLAPRVFLVGADYWLVRWYRGSSERAAVEINGRSGRVKYAIAGRELGWPPLARGQHGPHARALHVLLVVLGLLFLVPFVDPRSPLRPLHADLLAILAVGLSFGFAEAGNVYASTPLMYAPLVYLAVRLSLLAVRGSRSDPRPVTWMPPRVLGGALLTLLGLRYGLALAYGHVNDVGYDTLFGADSIIHRYPLYDPSSHLGSYGPVAYLAYVPFSLVFPFTDLSHLHPGAARAAAIAFDLGTVAMLYAIGRKLRKGAAGTELGLALAFAFAACPWTSLVLSQSTNDGLIALLLTLALLVATSPVGRGLVLGLAAAAKFAPLVLVGLFARVGRDRGRASPLVYGTALAATFGLIIWAYLPDSGLRGFWDATLGYELSRSAPFSLWGLHPELDPLRIVVTAAGAAMVGAAIFVPRERTVPRLAAAGAALLIVAQLTAIYWYYFYLVWFVPYALVALLSSEERTVVSVSSAQD